MSTGGQHRRRGFCSLAHDFVIGHDIRSRPDGLARLGVEGGEQQQGAVALVVVAAPLRLTAANPGRGTGSGGPGPHPNTTACRREAGIAIPAIEPR